MLEKKILSSGRNNSFGIGTAFLEAPTLGKRAPKVQSKAMGSVYPYGHDWTKRVSFGDFQLIQVCCTLKK